MKVCVLDASKEEEEGEGEQENDEKDNSEEKAEEKVPKKAALPKWERGCTDIAYV